MGATITPLFSSPLYQVNLEKELDIKELQQIFKNVDINDNAKLIKNTGNKFTIDQLFLNNLQETVFYKVIKKHLNIYFYELLKASSDIELYITQSWINKNDPGDFHHAHTHPNSFISGTFYYQTDADSGHFVLADTKYTPIEYRKEEYNVFNSNAWKLVPANYELILFPSSILHRVDINKSLRTRISVAFNTYLRGTINTGSTTGLILK
jgi:uncharacterized protein (TIGR02466 family)